MRFKIELWKEIKYKKIPEGLYSISDFGQVRNNSTGRILKQSLDYDGYRLITLSTRDGKGGHKTLRVNRLVALHFIDNPLNKPIVNHINSDRTDNRYFNLEWVTAQENTDHAIMKGNIKGRTRKYSDEIVHDICKLLTEGYKPQQIQEILKLDKSEVSFVWDIKYRRTRKKEIEGYKF